MDNNKNNIEREEKKSHYGTFHAPLTKVTFRALRQTLELMLFPMVSIKSPLLMISPSIYMFSLRPDFLISVDKLTECLIIISIIMCTFWTLEIPHVLS